MMTKITDNVDSVPEISPIHAQSMTYHLWMLYNSKVGTDINVKCGEKTYYLHSSVLSHGSTYFYNALIDKKSTIELDFPLNMDTVTFDIVVESLYTGVVRGLNDTNVTLVLGASFDLQVPYVIDACGNFMMNCLDIDNCLEYWLAAKMCCLDKVKVESIGVVGRHLQSIAKMQFFMEIQETTLVEILSDDNLQVPSEHWVYDAGMAWIKYDLENRKRKLNSVLEAVRLPLLPVHFLIAVVGKEDLIENDHAAMSKYSYALKCKLNTEARRETSRQTGTGHKLFKVRHGFTHFIKGSFERLTKESKSNEK